MLDARTLKSLASTPVGSSPQGDMLVDARNHRVYVSTGDGVDVLDARNAKLLLRIPLSASIQAVDEATNRVILTDYRGDFLLLDGRTSQVLAALRQPSPLGYGFPGTSMAVDPQTGTISYAAAQVSTPLRASSGPVRLYEVNGVTGRILHSCPIAAHPSAVAAAPQPGEVIVTDSGTNTATVLRVASCTVVRRIRVASAPVNIAVEAKSNLVVIESRMPQSSMPLSRNSVGANDTTVTIDAR
jgi:DNA-binding beta-propeller fold protein YncE